MNSATTDKKRVEQYIEGYRAGDRELIGPACNAASPGLASPSTVAMTHEQVLSAAREIVPMLYELVPDEADALRDEITPLLAAADRGEDVTDALIELLTRRPETRQWLHARLGETERTATGDPPPPPARGKPRRRLLGGRPGSDAPKPSRRMRGAPTPPPSAPETPTPSPSAPAAPTPPPELAPHEPHGPAEPGGVFEWGAAPPIPGDQHAEDLLVPATPGQATPPAEPDPPRSAYGLLSCPDSVAVGREFELTVGLAAEQQSGVAGGRIVRPETSVGAYEIAIAVDAPGFDLRDGETWRQRLQVTAADPYPTATLHLTPAAQVDERRDTKIEATYAIDGQTVGLAVRYVEVATSPPAAPVAAEPTAAGVTMAIPSAETAPDITIAIRRWDSESGGRLRWTVESPHDIDLPDASEEDIGEEPEAFAQGLVKAMIMREGKPGMYEFLLGRGRQIARQIPKPVRDAVRAAAGKAADDRPTCLVLSEEPYVPWELAVFDDPLLRDDLPDNTPPFLATQMVVGRWLLSDEPPPPPSPPTDVAVEKMAVVSGVYEKVAGWQRLQEAEDEAEAIRKRYGGAEVEATTRSVLDCLKGTPPGDVMHFAMHGKYDPNGVQHGLALVDGQMLDPAQVQAYPLASRPFVFLNACQVGAAEAILGDYAGMAASFLYAGASAVIAPLWSIDDKLAHSLAVDFYEEALTSDGRPAEILARYRRAIGGGDGVSGTYLAYQFFGHPRMRLAAERLALAGPDGGDEG